MNGSGLLRSPEANLKSCHPMLRRTRSLSDLRETSGNRSLIQASSDNRNDSLDKTHVSVVTTKECTNNLPIEVKDLTSEPSSLDGRLESLNTQALKSELRKRGLSQVGKKQVLLDRLKSAIQTSRQTPIVIAEDPNTSKVDLPVSDSTKSMEECPCYSLVCNLTSEVNALKSLTEKMNTMPAGDATELAENNHRIQKLKEENNRLRIQLSNLKDNNEKLIQERDSLKLALQVVSNDLLTKSKMEQSESVNDTITKNRNHDNIVNVENPTEWKHSTTKRNKRNKGRQSTDPSKSTNPNANSVPAEKKPAAAIQDRDRETSSGQDVNSPSHQQQEVSTILGDSIIQRIQGSAMTKKVGHRVIVKPFPGATVEDMQSYIKPALKRSPSRVILHAGTNDLKTKQPQEIADSLVDLAHTIESSSNAEVILSELLIRRDSHAQAVKEVNQRLRRFCTQNGWTLVSHSNITQSGLNRGGLHLNPSGNETLFNNFARLLANYTSA